MSTRSEIPAYILSAIAVVGIIILAVLHDVIPDVLQAIAVAGVGVSAALTNSKPSTP